MKEQNLCVMIALLAIGMWTLPQPARAQERELGGIAVGVVSTATVKAIDRDTRTVTLETSDGGMRTIRVSKEAENFDQIEVGDQVKAVAMEGYVIGKGGGSPQAAEGPTITRAPKGARPGVIISNTEEITAKVDSVDAANGTVVLQTADGRKPFKVAPDADVSFMEPGNQVTLKVTTGLSIWVEKPEAQPAAAAMKPGEAIAAMGGESATFTVEAINKEKHIVTLKTAEGKTRSIQLGKEAINFDQIQVGDKVTASLAEEVAVGISKGGAAPSASEGVLVARAPAGSKPRAIIAETSQVTGKIQAIDAEKRTLTLAEVDGKPRTIKVGPKVDLSKLTPGDNVTARVTAALAIVVEKP